MHDLMAINRAFIAGLDQLGAWGILTTDTGLRITGWNRWLEDHSQWPAARVVGRPLVEVFPDLVPRRLDRYYRQALAGHVVFLSQSFHRYVLPLPPTAPGPGLDHMQQAARLAPILEGGEVCGTLTLIEDVTERVAGEEALRRHAEALAEANRHKDEFLAMLAHELRNPLGPIRNATHLLRTTGSAEPHLRRAQEVIERQVAHMARLIDDLLDVSRLSRGKTLLRMERIDLAQLARQTAEDFRPVLEASGLRLEVDLPPRPLPVQGDPTRLAQMIGNLLHNAHKFTDAGGTVTVRAAADGPTAEVRVQDTGIGMEAGMLARVFDTFTQADRSLARSRGGLGLGLALVKGLAQLHDGTVTAHSAGLGRGSEFVLRLPLMAEAAPPAPAAPPVVAAARRFRVLIVEDNRDMAESTQLLLELAGHEVRVAYTGPDGLAQARAFRPDVLLCDIGLPGGLSGHDVARAVRQDPALADTYVIAMSGYGRELDQKEALAAGFHLHLTKPVEFPILQRALATLPARSDQAHAGAPGAAAP